METPLRQQKPLDVSAEQTVSTEFVRLIRKLRWMGMEDEAERVQMQLALGRVPPSESVLAVPRDTD
jgi:hypothetical protein